MTPYDNEIYRGPPDTAPTLAQELLPGAGDIYIIAPPQTTARQDVPATQETAAQDNPRPKKRSDRIVKAMKLLASCTAAVVIATTLSTPLQAAPKEVHRWPFFGPVDGYGNYSFRAVSENSQPRQVSIGGRSFRLTAQREDLHLQWHESYDISEDGSSGGFYLDMESSTEGWAMILDFNVNPRSREEPEEGLGQIQTPDGPLYVRSFFLDDTPPVSAQEVIDNLSDYIRISDAVAGGWANVCIGETIYSTTDSEWNGLMSISPRDTDCNFRRLCYTGVAGYSLDNRIAQREVNGISWSFYWSIEKGELVVWAVPEQENIAFGHYDYYTLSELGIYDYASDDLSKSEEVAAALRPALLRTVENIIASGLSHYYLMP